MTADVLVIGDVMVDVVAFPSGPLQHGSDVDSRIETVDGGSAANTACWLAEQGRPTDLVVMVGDDATGARARAAVERHGVTFVGGVLSGGRTGTCVVLVDPDGERTMLPDRGANSLLDPALVEAAIAAGPRWVHLSGYTLLDEGARPAAFVAMDTCREAGIPFSVDASSAGPLLTIGGARFRDWIDGCRILFANDDELAALGGPEACLRRVQVVVAKHGPAGASWVEPDDEWTVSAVSVTVVDTIGAGDALNAGVIHAVLAGSDPTAALTAGADLAARAVAALGARRPAPARHHVRVTGRRSGGNVGS